MQCNLSFALLFATLCCCTYVNQNSKRTVFWYMLQMPRTHRPDLSLCVKPTLQSHKHLARGIGPLVATQFLLFCVLSGAENLVIFDH